MLLSLCLVTDRQLLVMEIEQEPFVLGVTMEHLHAHSTDDSWDETFIKGPHQFVHKLVTLKNVAVYWNPRGDFLDYTSLSEMGEAMKKLVRCSNARDVVLKRGFVDYVSFLSLLWYYLPRSRFGSTTKTCRPN